MAAIKKRGRAGLARTLLLSFTASLLLLAPVVYFSHRVTLICCISFLFSFFFLSVPYKKAPVSAAPNPSLLFENANGFYLRPAPVTEWVRGLWEVFFFCFFIWRAAVGVVFLPPPRPQSFVYSRNLSVLTAREMFCGEWQREPLIQVQILPVAGLRGGASAWGASQRSASAADALLSCGE